jgi:hypothetical protein
MSKILTKDELEEKIWEYYIEHYGEDEGDVWFDPTAVNVRTFLRDSKYITLKSHILTGEVEEHVECLRTGDHK